MTTAGTIARSSDPLDVDDEPADREGPRRPSASELSRRRFTIAVVIGMAVVLVPLLWVQWDLWSGSLHPLRAVPYDNFYELQARAMFHGRLDVPNGAFSFEAFVHHGREYTYFGIFPSILRMPVLLATNRFDGELTAPSILLAWLTTGLFSSLLLWRLRILMRGRALLGRAEAASFGMLAATIMGGSVILFLAATPFIYNEDFAWSVPLTIGSLFALLGVLEKPSWGRVVASGVLVLATNLNRTPAGFACVIGAGLVAVWFALGRGGASNRRWALPVAAVAIVPFAVGCAVTYAKFGIPIGLPMADQVWASVNAHRRYFLAANGGKAFSLHFLPSTLWAYLQPAGIHLSGLFPFIRTPTAPAASLAGAAMDQTYPTASIPATMPLLFGLSCWGVVAAFRPKAPGQVRLTRLILVTAAAGTAGVLVWGYIAERYMADFMPFLVLAGGIGFIDVWRRLEKKPRRTRGGALGIIVVLGIYGVVANVAIASTPVVSWTKTQVDGFVSAEQSLSVQSLASHVERGTTLPLWAPLGQLFAMNNCSGLYLSTGNDNRNIPGQMVQHYTWLPVEQSASFTRTLRLTFNRPVSGLTAPVPLMTYGASTLVLEPNGPGYARMRIENSGTSISWPPAHGWSLPVGPSLLHVPLTFTVTVDPNLNAINVQWYGSKMLQHYVAGNGPMVVKAIPPSPDGVISVVPVPNPRTAPSNMHLCRSLSPGH